MADFDYFNPVHRKIRRYRTLAIKSALYSQEAPTMASARAWAFNAQSLTDLADIQERANRWDPAPRNPI